MALLRGRQKKGDRFLIRSNCPPSWFLVPQMRRNSKVSRQQQRPPLAAHQVFATASNQWKSQIIPDGYRGSTNGWLKELERGALLWLKVRACGQAAKSETERGAVPLVCWFHGAILTSRAQPIEAVLRAAQHRGGGWGGAPLRINTRGSWRAWHGIELERTPAAVAKRYLAVRETTLPR